MSMSKELTNEELKWGLDLVCKTFFNYLHNNRIEDEEEILPRFLEYQSCFVTYKKQGDLRGCIGSILPTRSLYDEIIEQSIQAAVGDPRFPPISLEEFNEVTAELTVLSPITKIDAATDFIPGAHGIIITHSGQRAVFLPQVATEQGWGREETLDNLAIKAGLQSQDWQLPETELEIFTAQKIANE